MFCTKKFFSGKVRIGAVQTNKSKKNICKKKDKSQNLLKKKETLFLNETLNF